MRGPALATFGTLCSQVRWVFPPVTRRSPSPNKNARDSPPPFGRSRNLRGSPTDTSANDRVFDVLLDAIGVPCDAVATVAVEVEAN